jgi:hypothetical protein
MSVTPDRMTPSPRPAPVLPVPMGTSTPIRPESPMPMRLERNLPFMHDGEEE